MNKLSSKQRGTPSNNPNDGDVFSVMLEAMSAAELTCALEDALENMTEDNYDPALIDAYLNALDRKDPIPEIPDAETSYASFQKRVLQILPERRNKTDASFRKLYRVWRVGLVAVLAIICMIGGMVVAQATGLDVFGAMARWTDNVFSLGPIWSGGAEDVPNGMILEQAANGIDSETKFKSIQEALDAFGVAEVSEPTWIPERYLLNSLETLCLPDGTLWRLSAEYTDGNDFLHFEIESYRGEPSSQVEKTDTDVETFSVSGIAVYLLENINNNMAAWATEHYECYISGAVEKSALQQMVFSAYASTE